ncbi:MAG: hypothetical protein VKJ02_12305 [Snowella sp.]|nr:hypothetical protein [Snowella sp.]
MFLTELQPILKELVQQPIAFTSGFVSGMLRLQLTSDPLKSWLEKQGVTDFSSTDFNNGSSASQRPQSISIE